MLHFKSEEIANIYLPLPTSGLMRRSRPNFFAALQWYCSRLSVVLLSYDSRFTLTRKLTRLRRRIGLQAKLFLLNLYVVGSLPCILKSNWIGLQVKLGRGEREKSNEQLTGGK